MEAQIDETYEALLTYIYGPKGADGKRPGKKAETIIDFDSIGRDGTYHFINVPEELGELMGISLEEVSDTEYITTFSQKTATYIRVYKAKVFANADGDILTDPEFGLQLTETYSYATDDVLLTYILGEVDATTGKRPGTGLETIIDMSSGGSDGKFTYINVPTELGAIEAREFKNLSDTEILLTFANIVGKEMYLYEYKVVLDAATESIKTSTEYGVVCLGKYAYSRVGKVVKYNDLNWVVLYDDDTHGLQLVLSQHNALATEAYAEAGYIDLTTTAIDLNQNGTIEDIEKSVGIYNSMPSVYATTMNKMPLDKSCPLLYMRNTVE